MAQQYQIKQSKKDARKGKEFVNATHEFAVKTDFYLTKCPAKVKDLVTLIIDEGYKIEEYVLKANGIYIPHITKTAIDSKNTDELVTLADQYICSMDQRDEILREAIAEFPVFQARFDRLLNQVDLYSSEKARMKKAVMSLIKNELPHIRETMNSGDPGQKQKVAIDIVVHWQNEENLIETRNNKKSVKKGFTNVDRDRVLGLRDKCKAEIIKRYKEDRENVKKVMRWKDDLLHNSDCT